MDITLATSNFTEIDLLPGVHLVDLGYGNNIVLLGNDSDKVESLLNALSRNLRMSGMSFARVRYEMMLHDWLSPTPSLKIESEVVERVDRFAWEVASTEMS
ncbi:unnamed protein product [Heterobilharzia americana]|nr:unnamed protein product [Heterobilharzia americana]